MILFSETRAILISFRQCRKNVSIDRDSDSDYRSSAVTPSRVKSNHNDRDRRDSETKYNSPFTLYNSGSDSESDAIV